MKMLPALISCLTSSLSSAFPWRIMGRSISSFYNEYLKLTEGYIFCFLPKESFFSSTTHFHYHVLKTKVWVHWTHSIIRVRCSCPCVVECMASLNLEWLVNAVFLFYVFAALFIFSNSHWKHYRNPRKIILLTLELLKLKRLQVCGNKNSMHLLKPHFPRFGKKSPLFTH
jgi:hypothetical protein